MLKKEGVKYHSMRIFRLQKRAVRFMVGVGPRDSCRKIFPSLKILPLPSLYIFSVLMFVINNWQLFTNNSNSSSIMTRNSSNLYYPPANLSIYQRGTQFIGIKIFNNLPNNIKQLYGNINLFKKTLLQFLYLHSFYSIDEFFKYKNNNLLIESIWSTLLYNTSDVYHNFKKSVINYLRIKEKIECNKIPFDLSMPGCLSGL
jgi:hypothetical protein